MNVLYVLLALLFALVVDVITLAIMDYQLEDQRKKSPERRNLIV